MDFNADGTRLASSFSTNIGHCTYLWDTETGELVLSFQGTENFISGSVFSPDGKQLIGWGATNGQLPMELGIRTIDTRTRDQIARDRRLARQRAVEFTPLVDSWIEKANGDDELVVAMLNREVNDRTSGEATTLRNLVLKKLCEQRAAN